MPFITSFANLLETEIESDLPQSQMMLDSFDTMLSLHLLRAYTSAPLDPAPANTPGTADLQDKLVAKAQSFLKSHTDEDIGIADVAHHLSVSRFHLARVFKARTGQTMHQFLLDKRVDQACALLRDTNLSIADIAYACGFSSQSHMTTVFGKRKGTSPGRYRAHIRA
ncbi:MAG: AraC family transcriptional regulator [Pseudomonadota bacterium]